MTSWFTQDVLGHLNPQHPPDYSPSALEIADSSLSDILSGRKGKVVDREGSGKNPSQWRNESTQESKSTRREFLNPRHFWHLATSFSHIKSA